MIRPTKAVHWILVALCAVAAESALAHHSFAGYDITRTVDVEGVVERFEFKNPHITLHLEIEDEHGVKAIYEVESHASWLLKRHGWSADSLVQGERIQLRAHPPKGDAKELWGLIVTKEDGSVLRFNPPRRKKNK